MCGLGVEVLAGERRARAWKLSHARYPDGRLEDTTLRRAAVDEGEVRVLAPVRLSDFIQLSGAGQWLGRRGR